jgi:hypothetical protein
VPLRWNTRHGYAPRSPFAWEEKRRELRDRLNGVPGISLDSRSPNGRPTFPLSLLELADRGGRLPLVELSPVQRLHL